MTISASLLLQQASAPAPQANTAPAAQAEQTETKPATANPTQTPAVTPSAESSNSSAKNQTSQQDRHSSAQTNNQANAEEPKAPPPQPKTEILDSSATAAALATDGHDPILDPAPLPTGITTLVGGVIADVDRVRNHLTVNIFGGGRWTVFFDERTHIFRSGAEVTQLALKKGDRVYVDTMLDNNGRDVFARNIRVGMVTQPADTEGQIVEIDARRSQLAMRDRVNSASVWFSVDESTVIRNGTSAAAFRDLRPGALVRVKFDPERPNRGVAREIFIMASPGWTFTFVGQLTFLDTHRGALAVRNSADNKTYDLHFSPQRTSGAGNLAVGDEVTITATFDGARYSAQQIVVNRTPGPAK